MPGKEASWDRGKDQKEFVTIIDFYLDLQSSLACLWW